MKDDEAEARIADELHQWGLDFLDVNATLDAWNRTLPRPKWLRWLPRRLRFRWEAGQALQSYVRSLPEYNERFRGSNDETWGPLQEQTVRCLDCGLLLRESEGPAHVAETGHRVELLTVSRQRRR